jgi:type 1 glutamine amidotransferase
MNIAVVTGEHGFEEDKFDELFDGMEGIEFVREDLSEFVKDTKRSQYETVVFYNFHQQNPDPETAKAILDLTEKGQGLVILHHAVLAFPNWEEFARVCNMSDRRLESFHIGEEVHVNVADKSHPITSGIDDWDMIDETYVVKDPNPDSRVLLTIDHPKSMKVIGWIHTYQKSRVFCFQSGHDNDTYSVPQFREVLVRGIRWAAGQL